MRKQNKALKLFKTLLFGSVLFFYSPAVTGQGECLNVEQSWEIGPYAGLSNFKGDIATVLKLSNTGYSYGGTLKYNLDHFSSLRLNVAAMNIWAKDSRMDFPMNQYRNEQFKASITELAGLFDYNFIPISHPKQLINWTPYLVGGLSVYYINTNHTNSGTKVSPVNMAIPFGGGSRIELNPQWIINFEFIARKTFTDAIDFPETEFSNGSQKTVTTDKDWFYTLQTGLSYTFYRVKCPPGTKDAL